MIRTVSRLLITSLSIKHRNFSEFKTGNDQRDMCVEIFVTCNKTNPWIGLEIEARWSRRDRTSFSRFWAKSCIGTVGGERDEGEAMAMILVSLSWDHRVLNWRLGERERERTFCICALHFYVRFICKCLFVLTKEAEKLGHVEIGHMPHHWHQLVELGYFFYTV